MSKPIPATPSFIAWQKAADRLLKLETALALGRRSVLPPESTGPSLAEIERAVREARLVADGLFRTAFAEAHLQAAIAKVRSRGPGRATARAAACATP
jgi:hypothetical protein